MSLLLDALKKAAEKKAKKGSDNTQRVEPTDKDQTEKDQTGTLTDESRNIATQHYDKAGVTEAVIMGAAEIEPDRDTKTDEDTDKTVPVYHTETPADESRLSAQQHDDTKAADAVIADSAETEADQNTRVVDTVEMQVPRLDQLELDQLEHDHLDQHQTEAEVNSEVDASDSETLAVMPAITNEDMIILDQDDDAMKLPTDMDKVGDQTHSDLTDAQPFAGDLMADSPESLTDDDVTEFMGDGIHDDKDKIRTDEPQQHAKPAAAAEDTTIANQDSLSLTNIEYDVEPELEDKTDAGYPMAQDSTKIGTHSLYGNQGRIPVNQSSPESLIRDDNPQQENETVMDNKSTISSVDFDKLTNDETVRVHSTTAPRTFAPDHYDRTLLNLSDREVSRIFPGTRPESDAVITPDYAKKVFMSKSSSIKSGNYKKYLAMALMLVLAVTVWGLFQLQDESDMIDRSLMSLKRDPMPGIIMPKNEAELRSIFTQQTDEANTTAIEIISQAGDMTGVETQDETPVNRDQPPTTSQKNAVTVNSNAEVVNSEAGEGQSKNTEKVSVARKTPEQPTAATTGVTAASTAKTPKPKKTVDVPARSTSTSLQVSSSSRISDKDQLLSSAYAAYEQGDLESARRDYVRVLTLDKENRDALLGRAAIHILENEYVSAIHNYQQVLLANPKDRMAMTSLISVANIDPSAGESKLKSLLSEQPESPYLHFVLGNMYGIQNRWSEAQKSYFNALQFKPKDPNFAYNLAVSLEHMGKPESAVTFYQQALENRSSGLATFDSQLVDQRIEVLGQ